MRGRIHQRRLPLPALHDVDVRAVLDQQADGRNTVRARCQHQRRLALRKSAIGFGTRAEQSLDQGCVAEHGRLVQRRHAVAVRSVCVGAGLQQLRDGSQVRQMSRVQERGGTLDIALVDVGALLQQCGDGGRIVPLHGVDESRALRHTEGQQQRHCERAG